ncbi:hypothetical protein D918_01868 [Trichuris suis]|nr:hypothetical protein D918_01868 [Trichuris suis]
MCSLKHHHDRLSFCYITVDKENANIKRLWEHEKSWHEVEVRITFKDLPPGMKKAKTKITADDKVKKPETSMKKEEEEKIADIAAVKGKTDKQKAREDDKFVKPEEGDKKEAIAEAAAAEGEKGKQGGATEAAQRLASEMKEMKKEIYTNRGTNVQGDACKSVEQIAKEFRQVEAQNKTKGITQVREAYEAVKKAAISENNDKSQQNIAKMEILPDDQNKIVKQTEMNKTDDKSKIDCEGKQMEREIPKAIVKEQTPVEPVDQLPLNVRLEEKAETHCQQQQVCKGSANEQASIDPAGKAPVSVLTKGQSAPNFAKTTKGGISLQNAPLEPAEQQLETPDQSERCNEKMGWKTKIRNVFHKGPPAKQKKAE